MVINISVVDDFFLVTERFWSWAGVEELPGWIQRVHEHRTCTGNGSLQQVFSQSPLLLVPVPVTVLLFESRVIYAFSVVTTCSTRRQGFRDVSRGKHLDYQSGIFVGQSSFPYLYRKWIASTGQSPLLLLPVLLFDSRSMRSEWVGNYLCYSVIT